MNLAASPAPPTTARDVAVSLRFGVDTGARQAHEIDPRAGRFAKSVERLVTLHDGRAEAAVLDTHGFELLAHPRPEVDWDDAAAVADAYYPQARALALDRTGASRAFLFDHTVRHGDEAVRAARGVREPAYGVHNDYTHWSSRKRMRDLLSHEAETLLQRRFAIVQIWRPIRHVIEADPIAIADARTIRESDLIPVNRISPGRVGETWQIAWHPRQRFYWFPRMTPDEALLFKVYDSATDGPARFTAHTAFRLPTQDATTSPRESCEVRMFVFF